MLSTIKRVYCFIKRPKCFKNIFQLWKKSCCFTLAFTSKSLKGRDLVLPGLYTKHNTFYMRVSNPCNILYIIHAPDPLHIYCCHSNIRHIGVQPVGLGFNYGTQTNDLYLLAFILIVRRQCYNDDPGCLCSKMMGVTMTKANVQKSLGNLAVCN